MDLNQNNLNTNSEKKGVVKITLTGIIRWILGLMFSLAGIVNLILSPINGIMLLIVAFLIFPFSSRIIEMTLRIRLSKVLKFIIIIICFVIIGVNSSKSTTTNTTSNQVNSTKETNTQQQEKPKEVIKEKVVETKEENKAIEVNYKTLHQDYMDNPINADTKYRYKLLRLTGNVKTIDREILGNTYVTFELGFLEDVRITFKKDQESKVAALKKGQKITIEGICNGTLLSKTVGLSDCELK